MSPMEEVKKSKWNWPYKGGQAVAQGFEKAKEQGLVANAYEAIKKTLNPTSEKDERKN
jgi:hypothetical protein